MDSKDTNESFRDIAQSTSAAALVVVCVEGKLRFLRGVCGAKPRAIAGPRRALARTGAMAAGPESAYQAFHKKQPLFTNFAQTCGQSEPLMETLDYIRYSPGGLHIVDCLPLPQTREGVAGQSPNG